MAPTHVNGRFPSAWKGAGSNFKCSFQVSSSPIADTGSLLSFHSKNLYNTNIWEVVGVLSCAKKQTLLHLDCLFVCTCRQRIYLCVDVTAKNGRNTYSKCEVKIYKNQSLFTRLLLGKILLVLAAAAMFWGRYKWILQTQNMILLLMESKITHIF